MTKDFAALTNRDFAALTNRMTPREAMHAWDRGFLAEVRKMNDQELLERVAEEIQTGEMLHLAMTPMTAFRLVGMLQLASRHRGPSADNREAVRWFVAHVRAHFAGCPGLLEVIRRGEDPSEDR